MYIGASMIRGVMGGIGSAFRWFVVTSVTLFLVSELIRVVWYVVKEWGPVHAITDGVTLYKLGETAILIPFFLHVHWNGVWTEEKSRFFVGKARWLIWFGGILAMVALFDLLNRVGWAIWLIPLIVLAITLPPLMDFLARRRAVWRGRVLASVILVLILSHYAFSFIITGYFITPLPSSLPSPAQTVDGRWQQDLEYMADNLPRLHRNAFHSIQKEAFETEVERLRDAIPDLNEQEIRIGFRRVAALIGDGHTSIRSWPGASGGRLPIRLYWLSDGLFVVAATEEYSNILGGRVLRLGNMTTDSVFDTVSTLLPAESNSYLLHHSVRYLVDVDILIGLKIAGEDGSVEITVEDMCGDTIVTSLPSIESSGRQKLIHMPETPPDYRSHSGREFWSEFYDDLKTAYLKYNSFTNPVAFPGFTESFWDTVEQESVEYVIVDFRENGGGYSLCFDSFIDEILVHPNINRKGHLYHLVNRGSFSSASLYTGIIRCETEAILAGEEMGGRLNHYGEMRTFKLPNSGGRVSYSTKYFELWPDSLPPFEIDLPIEVSSREYFSGEDPVLDSVLQLIRADLGKR